ncbi:MAG: helix-turn-helix domain-containing protein [Bacteroidaceae bacterium]|nr:helix-turn-helix domain-containing protein [Bacteroidaceae bacterium]
MQMPIESLNLLMLNVGFAQHDKDWNWQNVSSPFTRIYLVTEGEAKLHLQRPLPRDGEEVVVLRPGHLYIVPAYTAHSYECRGVFSHFYLHVYEGFKKETDVMDRYDLPTEVMAHEGDGWLLEEMCRRHPEAQLPESDPQSYDNTTKFTDYVHRYNEMPLHEKMQLRGAILMLFSRFMERAVPRMWTKDERMVKVLAHVHQYIYEDIDIDDLAEVACVTKPYLIRLFRQELGVTPLQYINHKKIEKAQLLLLTEDVAVKEVAYSLGFNDHSYFIRLFKKITGRTPQEYRMMYEV